MTCWEDTYRKDECEGPANELSGFTGVLERKTVDQCELGSQKLIHSIGQKPGSLIHPHFLLSSKQRSESTSEVHSSGGKNKPIPPATLRNTVAMEIASHRRSGKGTARKRIARYFFGQPTGWLFFCRSERRRTTYRTGCGREESQYEPNYREMEISKMTAKAFGGTATLLITHGATKKGGPCRQHEDDQANREHHILRRSRFDRKRYAIFRG